MGNQNWSFIIIKDVQVLAHTTVESLAAARLSRCRDGEQRLSREALHAHGQSLRIVIKQVKKHSCTVDEAYILALPDPPLALRVQEGRGWY